MEHFTLLAVAGLGLGTKSPLVNTKLISEMAMVAGFSHTRTKTNDERYLCSRHCRRSFSELKQRLGLRLPV